MKFVIGFIPVCSVEAPSGPESSEGVLGTVAHSIRYFMSSRQLITPTTPAFKQCSACGDMVSITL